MAALAQYAENLVINLLLRSMTPTVPSAQYVALYTSNPTALDVGTEISFIGTNYSRVPITFGAPSGGVCSNTGEIDFPVAGSTWGNITYAGIRDASTGGNLLFYGPLSVARFISSGDVLKFLIGNISVTVT